MKATVECAEKIRVGQRETQEGLGEGFGLRCNPPFCGVVEKDVVTHCFAVNVVAEAHRQAGPGAEDGAAPQLGERAARCLPHWREVDAKGGAVEVPPAVLLAPEPAEARVLVRPLAHPVSAYRRLEDVEHGGGEPVVEVSVRV